MSCVNEHNQLLLSDNEDTPLTIPCNTFFKESSSLLMKSSSHDNVSDDISVILVDLFIRSIISLLL